MTKQDIDLTNAPNFLIRKLAASAAEIKNLTEVYELDLCEAAYKYTRYMGDEDDLSKHIDAVLSATKELQEAAMIASRSLEGMTVVEEGDDE